MAYLDNSGLLVKWGQEATRPLTGGEYRNNGQLREIEIRLDLNNTNYFPSAGVNTIVNDEIFFPRSVMIQEVEIEVNVAATSGGSATLDVGLVSSVDRTTVTDATAFVAALPLASITPAGKKIVLNTGSTNAGTSIGAVTSIVNHISARVNTAVFTAGTIYIKIRYYRP